MKRVYLEVKATKTGIKHSYIDLGTKKVCNETVPYGSSGYQSTIYEYIPNLSLKDSNGWRDVNGVPVKPVKIKSLSSYKRDWSGIGGKTFCGDLPVATQFISDNYIDDIEFDINDYNVAYFDGETRSDEGFQDPQSPKTEVQAISIYLSRNDKIIVIADKENPGVKLKYSNKKVEYIVTDNERDLLLEFWSTISKYDVSILTGWNIVNYDIPYIINRSKICNIQYEKYLPFKSVTERFNKIENQMEYDFDGIIIHDMMLLYKKFAMTNQESYSLDFISKTELGEGKLEYKDNETKSLHELYEKDYLHFIEYNIQDTLLLYELENKLGYIGLALKLQYLTKSNSKDIYGTVKMVDSLIYNELKKQKIAAPLAKPDVQSRAYEGAYVEKPIPGMHDWLITYDYASLYPSIMRAWNMSTFKIKSWYEVPEEVQNAIPKDFAISDLINKKYDLSILKKYNLSLAGNGYFFDITKADYVCNVIGDIFNSRKKEKAEKFKIDERIEEINNKLTNDNSNELKEEKEKLEIKAKLLYNSEQAKKRFMNSVYGAFGNKYFRYFDVNVAEAITITGQYLIRNFKNKINEIGQKNFNCDILRYIDTDSGYFSVKPFLQKYCEKENKKLNELTNKEAFDFLIDLDKRYLGPKIDEINNDVLDYTNTIKKTIKMDQEKICDTSIFIKKKHYILNTIASDGIFLEKPKKIIKGIEIVRSSTPIHIRNQLKQLVNDIFEFRNEKVIRNKINEYKEEFENNTVEKVAFPRGVNGMTKYRDNCSSIYKKGTPIAVRGALLYNHYRKRLINDEIWKDTEDKSYLADYPNIGDREKVKFIYLKEPNPIHENVIAWPGDYKFPFKKLEKYIDWELQWKKVFTPVIEKLFDAIGWQFENKGELVIDI
jgi:DNA polymerase elongation subunit (family B)